MARSPADGGTGALVSGRALAGAPLLAGDAVGCGGAAARPGAACPLAAAGAAKPPDAPLAAAPLNAAAPGGLVALCCSCPTAAPLFGGWLLPLVAVPAAGTPARLLPADNAAGVCAEPCACPALPCVSLTGGGDLTCSGGRPRRFAGAPPPARPATEAVPCGGGGGCCGGGGGCCCCCCRCFRCCHGCCCCGCCCCCSRCERPGTDCSGWGARDLSHGVGAGDVRGAEYCCRAPAISAALLLVLLPCWPAAMANLPAESCRAALRRLWRLRHRRCGCCCRGDRIPGSRHAMPGAAPRPPGGRQLSCGLP